MIEKLQTLMKIYRLNAADLAERLGTERSGISHFLSGRNKPSLAFVVRLLEKFPELNPDWLLLDQGAMLRDASKIIQSNEIVIPFTEEHAEVDKQPDNESREIIEDHQSDEIMDTTKQATTIASEAKVEAKPDNSVKEERIVVFFSDGTYQSFRQRYD